MLALGARLPTESGHIGAILIREMGFIMGSTVVRLTAISLLVWTMFLFSGCATTESRFKEAKIKNSIEGYEAFVNNPENKGETVTKAIEILETLYFRKAKKDDTINALEKFLDRYPAGRHAGAARLRLEDLYFQKAEITGTVKSFEKFLDRFPAGRHASAVHSKLEELYFQKAESTGTIKSFEKFLELYPNTKHAGEAREWIALKKADKMNTITAYEAFLKNHSEGKYVGTARSKLEELYFQKAESTGTIKSFEKFLDRFPAGKHSDAVRSKLEEHYFQNTIKINSIKGYLKYYARFPHAKNVSDIRNSLYALGGAKVREQVDRLSSAEPKERYYAAVELGDMATNAIVAIPFLMDRLTDGAKLRVSTNSSYAFTTYTTSPAEEAKEALVKIGDPAVELLITALKNYPELIMDKWKRGGDSRDVPALVMNVLGRIGDERAVGPLIRFVNGGYSYWRSNAGEALEKIDPNWQKSEQAVNKVPEFITALKNKDVDVREHAADTLGLIGDERAVVPLIHSLGDSEHSVRSSAAYALGRIGDKRAVEPLIIALLNEKSVVPGSVVKALGLIGDTRAVEPLIMILMDKDKFPRRDVPKALGLIGDKRAVEPLTQSLRDSNELVRKYAAEALEKITGEKYNDD